MEEAVEEDAAESAHGAEEVVLHAAVEFSVVSGVEAVGVDLDLVDEE